ncbi:hypothetical protein F4679DRAFT_551733 [Xylaria curta]|nr:hypothetical protein F4679DRAFT_551733 [Xylaria curta]
MRLRLSALLALVLLTPSCVADSVQGDWVFPKTPNYATILQLGKEYKIQWVPGLASWFQYYCADCDTTAVDLWATGSENFNHEHKIASSVNVNSTLSVNWTATFLASELSDSPTWVLRFVPKGKDPASTTQQISSSIFVITNLDSASSSSSLLSSSPPPSSSSTSAPFSSSPTSSTPQASTSPTMTSSAVSGTETTTPPQSNSGLSTGAKVGIGVGSAVGAIALFTLGWIFSRRCGSKGDAPQEINGTASQTAYLNSSPHAYSGQGYTPMSTDVHELGEPRNPGIEMPGS